MNRTNLLRYLPNSLSIARAVLGLAFPWIPQPARPWVIAIAAATDALDGLTARWFQLSSDTGRLLDPIADKIFVLILAGTFVVEGSIHPLWALGIGARDLVVLFGAVGIALSSRRASLGQMWPTWLGKCTTAAQFSVLLIVAVQGTAPFGLFAATTALSVLAAVHYGLEFRRETAPGSLGPNTPR